jgi:RNA polymerase sigma-70 factor (ECF subfamily)
MTESTDDLVTRARAGDRSAQKELVRLWEESVFRIAWRVTGSHSAAEEVRQTVFLRMIERPETLPEPARFSAWLRRCTVNAAITFLRRQRVRAASDLSVNHSSPSIPPDRQAAENEEVRRLRNVLDTLQPEERAILTLRFDEDLSFPQIAEILDRPPSTVKSQYARLLNQLHSQLQDSPGSREEIDRHV